MSPAPRAVHSTCGPLELLAEQRHEALIKKSRFVVRALPVSSPEDALSTLEAMRDSSASHNCWAYRIGQQYRFSDDGEPGGTAGRPILGAIDARGVDGVLVVVTRYFGGVKLGAGGLARAYGGSAAECLRRAPLRRRIPMLHLQVALGFRDMGALYALLESSSAAKLEEAYDERGLTMILALPRDDEARFRAALADATSGRAQISSGADASEP